MSGGVQEAMNVFAYASGGRAGAAGSPGATGDEIEMEDGGDSTGGTTQQRPDFLRFLPLLTGRDRRMTEEARQLAIVLTQNADCDGALSNWGIESLAQLLAQLQIGGMETRDGIDIPTGNVFDGRTSEAKIKDDDGRDTEVRRYFRRNPGVRAITSDSPSTPVSAGNAQGIVFLGPGFFAGDQYDRAITLIHEAVHRAGYPDTRGGQS